MKAAFEEELDKCALSLETSKAALETWYSHRFEEKDIVGDVKFQYDELMASADKELCAYNGASKSVRNAVASWFSFCALHIDSILYILYIYIYVYVYMYMYVYIYTYIRYKAPKRRMGCHSL